MEGNINIAIWREMEARISKFGSAAKAKELRHKYMNPALDDETFEKVWAIILAALREDLDKIWIKHELDPNEVRKETASRTRGWAPKYPKAVPAKSKGKTTKAGGLTFVELDEVEYDS